MLRPVVLYQGALVVSVLVSGLATILAWRNRDQRGGAPLAVLLAATTVWSWSTLAATLWPGTPTAVFWGKVVLTSVPILVLSFLLFALSYTGREEYVTLRSLGILALHPVVFTALVWTSDSHNLIWRSVEFTTTSTDGLEKVTTSVYTAHTIYSYTLLAVAVVLIVVFALRSQYLYQRQVAAIVVATLVPWFANAAAHVTTLSYDPTPVAFTVTAIAFTWAVVREDFLDITPVATQMVLETIETGVFIVDDDGRVVDLNDRACDLLGVSTETALGSSARSLLEDLPNAQAVYDDIATARSSTTEEFAANGRYFRIQMSPLFERRDELVGHVFLLVDLTEAHRREEQLRRRNEQLDRFAGVVSHDLRNPIGVADGNLQLARETGEAEYFDRTERALDRMDRLVEDVLTLARQDEKHLTVTPVELGDVAESAWTYVDTADASLSVADGDLSVQGDSDRLSQLFENLFRNAVEHGGEDVTVTVEPLPGGEGFVVADDGPGFDGVDPESAFEDGFTTSKDGTGFGLSIVAEIVELHGWSVEAVESESGGARFEVVTDERS